MTQYIKKNPPPKVECPKSPNGKHEYQLDGWKWPEDFAKHYVLDHKVKPTDEFLIFIGYIK
jgi:hypothetical protein